MEKKEPKVGEKIVLKIYGSTVQVLITHLVKLKDGYKFKGLVRCKDYSDSKTPNDKTTEDSKLKFLHNELTIEGFMDEYGNWGK